MKKTEKYALLFLLAVMFLVRLWHIDVPPYEIAESWRQADTESMARNFLQVDANPLHPHLNYDGPLPNIPALEIQITTYIIALLYRLFGVHYFLARLVPIIFFLLSALFLYRFARIHLGSRGAFFSTVFYGFMPLNLYYSRAIMPESAALMFWIGSIYLFNLWAITARRKYLAVSSLLMALAIMTKPPVIFAGLFLLWLCFHYFGWKWVQRPALWVYALVTLTLPAVYYYYSASIADYKFTVGITQTIILKQSFSTLYSPETIMFFAQAIPLTFGVIGTAVLIASLFTLTRERAALGVWFLAMLLEVILIVSPIRAVYYMIFFTAPCALLMGNFIDRAFFFAGERLALADRVILRAREFIPTPNIRFQGKILCGLLIMALLMESYYIVKPLYAINTVMATQVSVIKHVTQRDDLLVVGSYDPCALSLSDRRGWRFNIHNYAGTPPDPYGELAQYIEQGAKYFVPIQGKIYGERADELIAFIDRTYPKIEPVSGYPVYRLQ